MTLPAALGLCAAFLAVRLVNLVVRPVTDRLKLALRSGLFALGLGVRADSVALPMLAHLLINGAACPNAPFASPTRLPGPSWVPSPPRRPAGWPWR